MYWWTNLLFSLDNSEHLGDTSSCEINEVEQGVAKLVLGWVTARLLQSSLIMYIFGTFGGLQ